MPLAPAEKQRLYEYCYRQMSLVAMTLEGSNSVAAQGGNIAFMEVILQGRQIFHAIAFSQSSRLPVRIIHLFAPAVPPSVYRPGFGDFTLGIPTDGRHANHTEPKLLVKLTEFFQNTHSDFDRILLASELNCCSSCIRHTVEALTAIVAVLDLRHYRDFIVVEIQSQQVNEGHDVASRYW
jgi:hypothetical protein